MSSRMTRLGGLGRPARSRRPTLEDLEGRALLAQGALRGVLATVAELQLQIAANPNFNGGPIRNLIGEGVAVKSPRFYPGYFGAPRSELNAAGAKALLTTGGDLVLTGIVTASQINAAPNSAAEESIYVFAINRGGATTPGPIPGRPHVTFDTTITVAIQRSGILVEARDLTTGGATPLPSANVLFKQNALQITVPSSVVASLPSTGTSRPVVTFWAQRVARVGDPSAIASFAPEFRGFPIAYGRIPHTGRS